MITAFMEKIESSHVSGRLVAFALSLLLLTGLSPFFLTQNAATLQASEATVELVAPTDNHIQNGNSLVFSWNEVPGALSYQIEIYTDENKSNIYDTSDTLNTSYTINIDDGTLWWNVRALADDGYGEWSELRKVTVDNTSPVVQIDSPSSTYVRGMLEVVGTITDANPNQYTFEVTDDGGNVVAGLGSGTSTETNLNFEWNTLDFPDGNYSIYLSARDSATNTARSSQARMDVIVDNTAPVAVISTPQNGSTLSSNDVNVSVSVNDPESSYQFVIKSSNGTTVFTSEQNSSTATVNLPNGSYQVLLTATDQAGNEDTDENSFQVNVQDEEEEPDKPKNKVKSLLCKLLEKILPQNSIVLRILCH